MSVDLPPVPGACDSGQTKGRPQPHFLLLFLLAALALCVAWDVLIPLYLAHKDGVVTQADVENRLKDPATRPALTWRCPAIEILTRAHIMPRDPAPDPVAQAIIDRRIKSRDACEAMADDLNNDLKTLSAYDVSEADIGRISSALQLRKQCNEVVQQSYSTTIEPYGLYVAGFVEERNLYVDLISSFSLFILVCVMSQQFGLPLRGKLAFFASCFAMALAYWVLIEIPPAWLRYQGAQTFAQGRRAYSYYSWSVATYGAEFEIWKDFLPSMLLAMLWIRGIELHRHWKDKFEPARDESGYGKIDKFDNIDETAKLFGQWQVNSLLLAAAFLPVSYIDWQLGHLGHDADGRYIFYGLIDHVTWFGTWALLTCPLWNGLKFWWKFKLSALAGNEPGVQGADALKAMEPVGHAGLIGASVAGAVAFLYPIVTGLMK
jgi:hypothetical protein